MKGRNSTISNVFVGSFSFAEFFINHWFICRFELFNWLYLLSANVKYLFLNSQMSWLKFCVLHKWIFQVYRGESLHTEDTILNFLIVWFNSLSSNSRVSQFNRFVVKKKQTSTYFKICEHFLRNSAFTEYWVKINQKKHDQKAKTYNLIAQVMYFSCLKTKPCVWRVVIVKERIFEMFKQCSLVQCYHNW